MQCKQTWHALGLGIEILGMLCFHLLGEHTSLQGVNGLILPNPNIFNPQSRIVGLVQVV
jgi:hypothetical protein